MVAEHAWHTSNVMLRRVGLLASLLESQQQEVSSLPQPLSGDHFEATSKFQTEYNTRSDQIFGTTRQMLNKFGSMLSAADRAVFELKEAREGTQAYLAAGQKFLKELEATCASTSVEHERRVAAREQDAEAVVMVIEILRFSDSHDLFFDALSKRWWTCPSRRLMDGS